jgi:hypothetical protein
MDVTTELYKSMIFVAQDEYFLLAMASVTVVAMLIGSVLYNGDLNQLKKASLTILTYGGLIAMTNVARIVNSPAGLVRAAMNQGQQFNGTVTILYVTLFYLFGIIIGVLIHWKVRHKLKTSIWGREFNV